MLAKIESQLFSYQIDIHCLVPKLMQSRFLKSEQPNRISYEREISPDRLCIAGKWRFLFFCRGLRPYRGGQADRRNFLVRIICMNFNSLNSSYNYFADLYLSNVLDIKWDFNILKSYYGYILFNKIIFLKTF